MSAKTKLGITILLSFFGFLIVALKTDNDLIFDLGLVIVVLNTLLIILVMSDLEELEENKKNEKILIEINEVLEKSKNGFYNHCVSENTTNQVLQKIKDNLNDTLREISGYLYKSNKILDEYEEEKKKNSL